jgi:hypothetical protein
VKPHFRRHSYCTVDAAWHVQKYHGTVPDYSESEMCDRATSYRRGGTDDPGSPVRPGWGLGPDSAGMWRAGLGGFCGQTESERIVALLELNLNFGTDRYFVYSTASTSRMSVVHNEN